MCGRVFLRPLQTGCVWSLNVSLPRCFELRFNDQPRSFSAASLSSFVVCFLHFCFVMNFSETVRGLDARPSLSHYMMLAHICSINTENFIKSCVYTTNSHTETKMRSHLFSIQSINKSEQDTHRETSHPSERSRTVRACPLQTSAKDNGPLPFALAHWCCRHSNGFKVGAEKPRVGWKRGAHPGPRVFGSERGGGAETSNHQTDEGTWKDGEVLCVVCLLPNMFVFRKKNLERFWWMTLWEQSSTDTDFFTPVIKQHTDCFSY